MPGRSENDVKNRFYSTLRRIARKDSAFQCPNDLTSKTYLVKFVDAAISSGHFCYSKRGRKKKRQELKVVGQCKETVCVEVNEKCEADTRKDEEVEKLQILIHEKEKMLIEAQERLINKIEQANIELRYIDPEESKELEDIQSSYYNLLKQLSDELAIKKACNSTSIIEGNFVPASL